MRTGLMPARWEPDLLENMAKPWSRRDGGKRVEPRQISGLTWISRIQISVKASTHSGGGGAYHGLSEEIDCPLHVASRRRAAMISGTYQILHRHGACCCGAAIGDTIAFRSAPIGWTEVRVGFRHSQVAEPCAPSRREQYVSAHPEARQGFNVIRHPRLRTLEERLETHRHPMRSHRLSGQTVGRVRASPILRVPPGGRPGKGHACSI